MPDLNPQKTIRRECLTVFGLAAVFVAFFGLVHASSPLLYGVDAYFHIKYSELMRAGGLVWDLPWLAFTIYTPDFADDHFLFHYLLIPFTIGNLILGAKLYGTLIATLVLLAFYTLLRLGNIRYPILWTGLLFICSPTFLMRITLARAPGVSLLFLLAGIGLILHRKDRWIAPLGFLYVWLYGGFPLLGAMAATACLVSLWQKKNPRWVLLLYCAAGLAAGLILNPYFPDNIRFLYTSYTRIELGTFPDNIPVGSEDYPYAASTAVRKALPVWVLLFLVLLYYITRPRALTADAVLLFLFSTILLCLYLKVRRYIEYWPPFAVLFAAYALDRPLREFSLSRAGHKSLVIAAVIAATAGGVHHSFSALKSSLASARDYRHYQPAALWLKDHSPQNAIVFNANWDDFPLLFHFNTHNRYIVGLGPPYLYLYDRDLYDKWLKIGRAEAEHPARLVREHFDARYIFTLTDEEEDFLAALDADPEARIVFEDANARVYQIREAPDASPGTSSTDRSRTNTR